MLTMFDTCNPVALAAPLLAEPPLPGALASPELANPRPQLKRSAARAMATLIGFLLSPATCTAADDFRSTVFWTCAPVAWALPVPAAWLAATPALPAAPAVAL